MCSCGIPLVPLAVFDWPAVFFHCSPFRCSTFDLTVFHWSPLRFSTGPPRAPTRPTCPSCNKSTESYKKPTKPTGNHLHPCCFPFVPLAVFHWPPLRFSTVSLFGVPLLNWRFSIGPPCGFPLVPLALNPPSVSLALSCYDRPKPRRRPRVPSSANQRSFQGSSSIWGAAGDPPQAFSIRPSPLWVRPFGTTESDSARFVRP